MSPTGGLHALGLLAGGLGLFLLHMAMMTVGLKLAAGPALHQIPAGATKTRWLALGSHVLVTAMVQSPCKNPRARAGTSGAFRSDRSSVLTCRKQRQVACHSKLKTWPLEGVVLTSLSFATAARATRSAPQGSAQHTPARPLSWKGRS